MSLEKLLGQHLCNPDGTYLDVSDLLNSKQYLVLYFGASWCAPCRAVGTPLKQLRTLLREKRKDDREGQMEVIYFSSDHTEEAFKEYIAQAPWPALPYSKRRAKIRVAQRYRVTAIPTLIVVTASGALLCPDAKEQLTLDPDGQHFPWPQKSLFGILGNTTLYRRTQATAVSTTADDVPGVPVSLEELRKLPDGFAVFFCSMATGHCRSFTPILKSIYRKIQARKPASMEIIYFSVDKSEAEYRESLESTAPEWLTVPYGDGAVSAISKILSVAGVPALITLANDGTVINASACTDASEDEEGLQYPWHPQPLAAVAPFVVSEDVLDAVNANVCVILWRNGSMNFASALEEFKNAAALYQSQRMSMQRGVAPNGKELTGLLGDDQEQVQFFVCESEKDELLERVREVMAVPEVPSGTPVVIVCAMAYNRQKEVFQGSVEGQAISSLVARFVEKLR